MHILLACQNLPQFRGAQTQALLTARLLRERGHRVHTLFPGEKSDPGETAASLKKILEENPVHAAHFYRFTSRFSFLREITGKSGVPTVSVLYEYEKTPETPPSATPRKTTEDRRRILEHSDMILSAAADFPVPPGKKSCALVGLLQKLPAASAATQKGETVFFTAMPPRHHEVELLLKALEGTGFALKISFLGTPEQRTVRLCSGGKYRSNAEILEAAGQKDAGEIPEESLALILASDGGEILPYPLPETFAGGRPAVAARMGYLPRWVGENRGLLFEPGDALSLRESLIRLACGKEKDEMGKKAGAWAEKYADSELFYRKLIQIYTAAGE